jgi:hypothetical protein
VFTDEQLEAAVAALSDPARFRGAEERLTAVAPQLQHILADALESGGWLGESNEAEVRAAADTVDPEERALRIRTLLADEARIGMLVGVAVGWELARELDES